MRRGLAWLRVQVDRAVLRMAPKPKPVDALPSDGGLPTPFKSETARPWPEYMDEDDTQPNWLGRVTIELRPASAEESSAWHLPWGPKAAESLANGELSGRVIYLDAHRPKRALND